MDTLSPTARSALMARIRSRDTKPERLVRRYLFARGYRFRKNVSRLPGRPDIVLRRYHTVIFVNGCFWHGHEPHSRIPDNPFWRQKIERNRQRDELNRQRLQALGWDVITVWECQLAPDQAPSTLAEIERLLNATFLRRQTTRPPTPLPRPYSLPPEEAPAIAAEPLK
ncbi:MAG: very short patch repair endonuclease [Bacteroidales bacterium]|nr:very short patch repair endonuclease [Bacteroidales bacterium]